MFYSGAVQFLVIVGDYQAGNYVTRIKDDLITSSFRVEISVAFLLLVGVRLRQKTGVGKQTLVLGTPFLVFK